LLLPPAILALHTTALPDYDDKYNLSTPLCSIMDAHPFAHHQPLYYDQAYAASSSSHPQHHHHQQPQRPLDYQPRFNHSSSSSSSSSSPASHPTPFSHHDDDALYHRPGSADPHGGQDTAMTTLQAFTQDNGLVAGLSRPLTHQEHDRLANLERLKYFLATAPSAWSNASGTSSSTLSHPALNRFLLPNQEYVTCVVWGGLYHITGTDIVRALVFRFEAFGRPVRNMKKFEEGIFSDLRNLKPGVDACLEEPKARSLPP
jgi:transcription factor STE12